MTKQSFGSFAYKKFGIYFFAAGILLSAAFLWSIFDAEAKNIRTYSDTLSNSAPERVSNHTLSFTLDAAVSPGGYLDFVPPNGFTISASSTFSARNVEMYVNDVLRAASSTGSVATDTVTITPGTPGKIRYTLNPTTGVAAGDHISLRIGTQTSQAHNGQTLYSTSTGTTTLGYDTAIKNADSTGTHKASLRVWSGGSEVAYTDFIVFLNERIGLGPADTTEEIPPERFNGAPTGQVGGTTLSAELSVETNEFAICKYSETPGVDFFDMTNIFSSTGYVVHTKLLTGFTNETTYSYYVRCIDDEDNYNIDDYEITFTILPVPDGDPNTTGSTTGDGTGSGNQETGTDTDAGGETGEGSGDQNTGGTTSGGGGSGGGGGGGSGSSSGSSGGGGFEDTDAPYESGDATVVISGYAFPRSTITVLVDGQQAKTGNTNNAGEFSIRLEGVSRGVYTFGIYATDDDNNKSTTFSTSFSVRGARTSTLSNVNITPTVVANPDPVDLGSTVTLSGHSIPNANITVENLDEKRSSSRKTFTTTSGADGSWSVQVSTSGFSRGTYKARARAKTDSLETNFSDYTYYGVGQNADVQINADLNRDGKVNLIDFSILLFWWGSNGGNSDPSADINRDGNVSLTDFSIMLFQWTG